MRDKTIGRQVATGFAACLGVLLLMAVLGTVALQRVADAKDEVIQRHAPLVAQAHELGSLSASKSAAARAFLLTGDDSELSVLRAHDDEFERLLRQVQGDAAPGLEDTVAAVARSDDEWDQAMEPLLEQRRVNGSADAVADTFETTLLPAYQRVFAALDSLATQESAVISQAVERSDDQKRAAVLTLWGVAVLAIAASTALAAWITRRVSRQLTTLALGVDAAAQEILAGVQQQVSGATQQAAAVQQTAATVDELVQTAEQAVERAQNVSSRAQQSVDVAAEGTSAVGNSTAGMRQIREQVDGIARSILELSQRAQMIGDIVGTVESIAAETHLLALNASIEAARAGEHGRGFAVVAGEVKNLADQSRAATGRVSAILAEIEQGTSAAVMATEEGTKSTQAGIELVERTGHVIEELAGTISSAALAAEQIAASSRQQAAATVQISQAMRNVDSVMEQNVAAARQSQETAGTLTEAARQMKQLVGAR
jgi:methyl-accepting chemotaxis protein